jgi:hypothetical protein
MQTTDATEELKNAIMLAEVRLSTDRQMLKEQLLLTYDSLRPANLLRSTLKELSTSPFLIGNLAGSVIGLATGYLSNKVVIGSSVSVLRRLLGSVLQLGITNIISKNSEVIKSGSKNFLRHLLHKRESGS